MRVPASIGASFQKLAAFCRSANVEAPIDGRAGTTTARPEPSPAGLEPLRLFHTSAFRWTLASACIVALGIAAMGGFFYWQTVGFFTTQLDSGLVLEARSLMKENRRVLSLRLDKALSVDPRASKAYGLFGADGTKLVGDVEALPGRLPPPDRPVAVTVDWTRHGPAERVEVRAIAVPLADGTVLFLGRSAGDLQEIDAIVRRAMTLAVVPAALLALVGGGVVSVGTLRRVEAVRRACSLITEGQFHRRLPVGRRRDEFDRLSELVNRMLEEIERLVEEVQGAGDAIAHDLRTPLTRLRTRIGRALDPGARHAPVEEVLGKSMADVDQLLATVSAILRLAEVEQARRRTGFGPVDLDDVLEAVAELYLPVAEEKGVGFAARGGAVPGVATIVGDADLVFEAVANLVDNAIKFTPPGGHVALILEGQGGGATIRVSDTGPGIPPGESSAVMRRFYRGDRSRHLPGTGLGLSLVAAIVRLHGFGLSIGMRPGGGCEIVLLFGPGDADGEARSAARERSDPAAA